MCGNITEIKNLGSCKIDSPFLKLGHLEDLRSDIFICNESRVLLDCISCSDKPDKQDDCYLSCPDNKEKPQSLSFERAGPREKIFFDTSKIKAGIVTCGGLCPGLNDVVRSIVHGLWHSYGVKHIYGFRYGYQGFVPKYGHEAWELNPDMVDGWQDLGGTILGSSRGPQDPADIVDCLERMSVNILFVLGGDGTMKGALAIAEEIEKRNEKISVVGIPKTIDNDILFVDETFGFRSAVEAACDILRCAHAEAKGTPHGIGLVKLMGRDSGFIACQSALSMGDVNYVLIPEKPFNLERFLDSLHKRLEKRKHAVIAVAEGAGQNLMQGKENIDASGNHLHNDIGLFLKQKIKDYFKDINFETSIKYIDPSYIIRSIPANAQDSVYCLSLGHDAVHAAMAGKTEMLVGTINGKMSHIPMPMVTTGRKKVEHNGQLWSMVMQATGQIGIFD